MGKIRTQKATDKLRTARENLTPNTTKSELIEKEKRNLKIITDNIDVINKRKNEIQIEGMRRQKTGVESDSVGHSIDFLANELNTKFGIKLSGRQLANYLYVAEDPDARRAVELYDARIRIVATLKNASKLISDSEPGLDSSDFPLYDHDGRLIWYFYIIETMLTVDNKIYMKIGIAQGLPQRFLEYVTQSPWMPMRFIAAIPCDPEKIALLKADGTLYDHESLARALERKLKNRLQKRSLLIEKGNGKFSEWFHKNNESLKIVSTFFEKYSKKIEYKPINTSIPNPVNQIEIKYDYSMTDYSDFLKLRQVRLEQNMQKSEEKLLQIRKSFNE